MKAIVQEGYGSSDGGPAGRWLVVRHLWRGLGQRSLRYARSGAAFAERPAQG